jgi:alanyl-tRNA synthetase
VRLTFTAGSATKEQEVEDSLIINQLEKLLEIPQNKIIGRVEELLNKWKNLNKAVQTGKFSDEDLLLDSTNSSELEILTELARILNTKKEQVPQKVSKLYNEWNDAKAKLKDLENLFGEKFIENLVKSAFLFKNSKIIIKSFENRTQNDLKNLSMKILSKSEDLNTILISKDKKGITIIGMVGKELMKRSDYNMGQFVKEIATKYGGKGGGKKDYGQVFIGDKEVTTDDLVNYIKEKLIDN